MISSLIDDDDEDASASLLQVEPAPPNIALMLLCLCTGLVDSLTFTVTGVWCAFVTGVTIQLGMDLPTLLTSFTFPPSSAALKSHTSARLTTLTFFVVGAAVGSRAPKSVTPAISSIIQSALLACAGALLFFNLTIHGDVNAGRAHNLGLPYAHATLALVAMSMAMQAVVVQRFATPYATSVAWTGVWLGVVAPGSSSRRLKKAAGLMALILGAALGAVVMRLGRQNGEGGKDELVRRVGYGLALASAIKMLVAGMFWRRSKAGRIRLP